MSAIDSISKTSIKMLLSEPFYGHFMMGLPKEISVETETIALALMNRQTLKLIVNEVFWNELNDEQRYGLIKHELLHIVLRHLFKISHYPNKSIFNIAADLVVNQYIDRKQLQEDAILIERFSYLFLMYGITLERDKSLDYYYRQLDKVFKQRPLVSFEEAIIKMKSLSKQSEPQVPITTLLSKGHKELNRHKFWKVFEQLSEAERKIITYQANRMIQQTTDRVRHKYKNYGNLPQELTEKIAYILEDMKPRFNWRRILRLFAASSNSTFVKNTIRRPSKRYGSVPGVKIKRRNRLLLAIDTSGSIQQKELQEVFKEIYFIWRQGAEIRVVECDKTIHKNYDYKGVLPVMIHGRGGTSLEAPIQYGNENYRPDALLYFTDGFAAIPKTPARYPILWIISSDGLKEGEGIWKQLPGKKLKISVKK